MTPKNLKKKLCSQIYKYTTWKLDFHLWGFTITHKSTMLSLNIQGSSSWTIAISLIKATKASPLEHMHMSNSFDFIEDIHKVDKTWEQNHGFDRI